MTAGATRRGLMALASSAAMRPAMAVGAAHPDAELLEACARFRALNDRHAAIYNAEYGPEFPDDDSKDAAWSIHRPQQSAALDALCAARATTLEGVVARGLTLAEYAPDLMDPDERSDYVDDRQIMALLRDLVALAR